MSVEITEWFVQQYKSGIIMLSQQKKSRLRGAVRVEDQQGKNAFYDRVGATAMQKRVTRHGDTPLMNTPHSRRRVSITPYDWADLIDDPDKVRTLNDPTNSYVQSAAAASGRSIDDVIIEAAFGTAYSGEEGSTSVSFPAGNQIAAGAAGLTVAKLLEAKEKLDEAEVDESIPRYVACSAKQISDLLNTTEVKSSDYNTVKALAEGRMNSYLGFEFIRTERLDTDGSSDRRCIAWAMDGLLLAVGTNPAGKISERDDKNYSTQVFFSMDIGATRMEEEKVIEIKCVES